MKALCIGTRFGSREAHEDSRPEVVSRTGSIERSYKGQEAPTDICIIPTDMHLTLYPMHTDEVFPGQYITCLVRVLEL